METWKDILGFEGFYQVSDLGRVKSLKRTVMRRNGRPLNLQERILRYATNREGYAYVMLCSNDMHKCFTVHRLEMYAFKGISDLDIDHKDGNKLNNKLSNLRYCSTRQNVIFSAERADSTSKYVGVHWCSREQRWISKIKINGKTKFLGQFMNEETASEKYQTALRQLA